MDKGLQAPMKLRKEKGLYYFFDDKFCFSHKCPQQAAHVASI
jgi:hypothetical protein